MHGFFSPEAMAALQQAYELQLTPEEMDIDQVTGLPTNQVSNTAPWHGTVEMWKYPDGVKPTKPGEIHYIARDGEEEEAEEESIEALYEEEESSEEPMSEEEVDALIDELLSSDEDD